MLRQSGREGCVFRADRCHVDHFSVDQLNTVAFSEYAGGNHLLVTIDANSCFLRNEGHTHRCAPNQPLRRATVSLFGSAQEIDCVRGTLSDTTPRTMRGSRTIMPNREHPPNRLRGIGFMIAGVFV